MKKLKKLLLTVIAASLCITCFAPIGGLVGNKASAAGFSPALDMIVTNPAEDASTAMNVGFHALLGYTNCYVQYTLKSDTEWANAKNQSGTYVVYGADEETNPFYNGYSKDYSGENYYQTNTFLDYSVTLNDLTPATEYKYRVCDGARFSDTYYFKTAGADEWSFVVTGDFHVYYTSGRADNATKAVNAAISLANQQNLPPVEHIVSIGDIVAWGISYNQWQLLVRQPYFKNYSFANAIGNHDDMDRFGGSSSAYNAICFNNPTNGYGDEVGTCFYYLYNDVLFIYVNYLDPSAEAEAWATKVVNSMAGKYKYSILVNHRPATSKYNGGTYSYFWNYWADFCDTNKIDMVLAGDHHVYMRSNAIKDGSVVTNYGASNPDGTVYMAADSADGDRGSGTDVTSNWSNLVASHYYRYEYSGSSADITSMLVTVKEDKITTQFVYYETSATASHPSFREGSVSGHTGFYYGDTSYVYPSDHSASGDGDVQPDINGFPADAVNLLSTEYRGSYKYLTSFYPGGSTYYNVAYYGDNANQGGSYISGKLNDGTLAANSNPGVSNNDWAVFFTTGGVPDISFKLNDTSTVYGVVLNYRGYTGGAYSVAAVTAVRVSDDGETFTDVTDYTVTSTVASGDNYNLNIVFDEAIDTKYLQVVLAKPDNGATRYAVSEVKIMGKGDWTDNVGGDYTVEFKDYDGTTLSTQTVDNGKAAVPPAVSLRAGYYFVGWDKDFNSISEDTVITAMYSDGEDEVIFVDYDGTELSRQTVAFGSAATPPADPEREQHVFLGWDKPYDAIAGDTVITATYIHEDDLKQQEEDKEIIPIPLGDNILLNRPYTTVFNQYLGASTADTGALLTNGKYRGDGTSPWGVMYGTTVEFAGSAAVNSLSFEFDTATDVGVVIFKNVRITGNRGFAADSVEYSTDGTNFTKADIKSAQVLVQGANENVYYDIRIIVNAKNVKALKVAWTNNGEYVSQFDEVEGYSSYYAEGEEPPSDSSSEDVSSEETSDVVSSDEETSDVVSSDEETSDVVSSDEETSDVVSSDEETSDVVSSDEETSDVVSSDEETSEDQADILYGDVNGDGVVNSLVAAQVLKHDALLIVLEGNALVAGDVNVDEAVNSLDAAQILKYDAKLIQSFAAETAE